MIHDRNVQAAQAAQLTALAIGAALGGSKKNTALKAFEERLQQLTNPPSD